MSVRRINFSFVISHPDLGDVTIPISSFTARIREGSPSYLQVVVPDYNTYANAILSRTTHCRNCELTIYRTLDGDSSTITEVLTVDFENLRADIGSRSQSIFLVGHRTSYNASPRTVTLTDIDYVRYGIDVEEDPTNRVRFSAYLDVTAGDTVEYTLGADAYSFTVGLLTLNATQYDFEQEASS